MYGLIERKKSTLFHQSLVQHALIYKHLRSAKNCTTKNSPMLKMSTKKAKPFELRFRALLYNPICQGFII